jgi:hypothetical protein
MALCPQNHLEQAKLAGIYITFLDTLPPPKVESYWPFFWHMVWRRLWTSGLSHLMVDMYFMLLHNILPLRGRLADFGVVTGSLCSHCGGKRTSSSAAHG